VATPRIPVHHAQELPIGGKLPSYFILKSLTQSFPLEWRDVLRYQRLRKLHADLHAANCAPLRDPFGADPARLLGRGLSRQQVMARAARHRESDAASRRAYVWADVATRFGGTSEGLALLCTKSSLWSTRTDVLRQVIKVAALWVALTVARPGAAYRIGPPAIGAANRLIEDCRIPDAKPFRERHDLGSVIEITVRAAI
jgi:hypothetical protein